ncbi:hypothetical protein N7G274_009304 [Stereocaulon virgatum]|uniref:Uncharacterized protein n=1 Tax=Stereocaulon virgatum TaxID=373712 RepID=A0ABR3ZST0_9LECA
MQFFVLCCRPGGSRLIIGMPALHMSGVVVDTLARQWRYQINPKLMQLDGPAEFGKVLQQEQRVFAVVCAGAVMAERPRADESDAILPPELKELKMCSQMRKQGSCLNKSRETTLLS